jgi:maltose O-acetyltransferase
MRPGKLARALILSLAAAGPLPDRLRRPLLRIVGFSVAPDCGIRSGLRVSGSARVELGAGVYINHDVFILADAPVSVGRNAQLGPGMQLITADHELGGPQMRVGRDICAPIVVGEGAWVGARVTVLPGVTIGPGCVIGAGAVVREDCAANTLYAGVPARAVRELPT